MWYLVVKELDLRSRGHEFDSRPQCSRATTLSKLFTPFASITKQYKLVAALRGTAEVTAGLAESNGGIYGVIHFTSPAG